MSIGVPFYLCIGISRRPVDFSPNKDHFTVYSLKYYELLLRTATEFESICKDKLMELKLSDKKPEQFGIREYYLLNSHFEQKPSKIKVGYLFSDPVFVQPLKSWSDGHSLNWYKSYNAVKHNRAALFEKANLYNVLEAIGALFIMIERFDLCPKGKLATLASSGGVSMRSHPEWPVVIEKLY